MKSPVKIYLRVRLPDNSYPPHAIHEEALLCVACFYGWCGWLDSRRSGFWCDAQGNRLQFVNLPLEVDHRKGRIVPGWFPDTPSSEWVAQILLHFLLCTGAREQDAQYVCWSDVDLERKTYTVTEHLDLGYRPKDKEEGTLPIPDLLVNVLRNRRERYPRTRLIFPGQRGERTATRYASSSASPSR
jgi:integrase